jgi:thioredoxin 1
MSHQELTDQNFSQIVENSKGLVLVDFWAPWCGPCRILGPVIEEIAQELKDKLVVGKLNVDENQQIAGKYRVMSIPTVILFKDGKILQNLVGVQPKQVYLDLIRENQ